MTGDEQKRNRRRQKDAAETLAATQLDRMTDASASTEVKASRKKRLVKGPEEFRDARKAGGDQQD